MVNIQEGLAKLQSTVMQDHRNSFTELCKNFFSAAIPECMLANHEGHIFVSVTELPLRLHVPRYSMPLRTTNMENLYNVPDYKAYGQKWG